MALNTPTAISQLPLCIFLGLVALAAGSMINDVPPDLGTGIATACVLFVASIALKKGLDDSSSRLFIILLLFLVARFIIALFIQPLIYGPGGFYQEYDAIGHAAVGASIASSLRFDLFTGLKAFLTEFQPGTNSFTWIVGFIYYLNGDSYTSLSVINAWLGWLGVYYFCKAFFVPGWDARQKRFYLLLMSLSPSILLWTSLPLKDSLTFLGLSLIAHGAIRYDAFGRASSLVEILIGIGLVAIIRPHMALIVLSALFIGFTAISILRKKTGIGIPKLTPQRLILIALMVLSIRYVLNLTIELLGAEASLIDRLSVIKGASAMGGSAIAVKPIMSVNDLGSVFYNVTAVLFRPFLWEASSAFSFIAGLENTLLALVLLLVMLRLRFLIQAPSFSPLFCASYLLVFPLAFAFTIGNLGTMVRLKVHIYPFLFALAISSSPENRLARILGPTRTQEGG